MLYILIPAALDLYYHLFSHHLAIFKFLLLGFRAFIVALLTSFHLFLFADFLWAAHMLFPYWACLNALEFAQLMRKSHHTSGTCIKCLI